MTAYYNDNDPVAVAWLRGLISRGHIAPGDVDERSIADVSADDLRGYTQCHFFAGIGGWSYAARLAGWPDDRPLWTGSCPCQPFSQAGRRQGAADERHMWPEWLRLIGECRPAIVAGEQVASPDGRHWLAAVRADLEAMGYAVGAADLCASGVGAPHPRQRLYFGGLADSDDSRSQGRRERRHGADERVAGAGGVDGRLADANGQRHQELDPLLRPEAFGRDTPAFFQTAGSGADRWLGPPEGFWRDADWLACRDGKWRPVEPGTFPLADGIPARVGRLRGYGNAIVPQVAATFLTAMLEEVQ